MPYFTTARSAVLSAFCLPAIFLVAAGSTGLAGDWSLQVALSAWKSYCNALDNRGFVVEKQTVVDGKDITELYRWSGEGAALETNNPQLAKNPSGVVAYVRNQEYAFKAARDGKSPWLLQDLLLTRLDTNKPATPLALMLSDVGNPAHFGLCVYNEFLPTAIETGSITIESSREIGDGRDRAVELAIRTGPTPATKTAKSGTITVVPAYSWMITEARIDLTSIGRTPETKGVWECKNTYTTDTTDVFATNTSGQLSVAVPVLIKSTEYTTSWEKTTPWVRKTEFHWKPTVPMASDFRLTSYGLHEPALLPERWARRVVLMLVGALIIIIAIVLLRRRKSDTADMMPR